MPNPGRFMHLVCLSFGSEWEHEVVKLWCSFPLHFKLVTILQVSHCYHVNDTPGNCITLWSMSVGPKYMKSFFREIDPYVANHFSTNILSWFLWPAGIPIRNRSLGKWKTILEEHQECEIIPGECCHLIWTGQFQDFLSVQILSHRLIKWFSEWKQCTPSMTYYITPSQ